MTAETMTVETTTMVLEKKALKQKPRIAIHEINLPKGVEVRQTKTATTFFRKAKKAILKSHALEVTNVVKSLGERLQTYSDEMIERCHLGTVRGIVKGVKDKNDLQKILTRYFK